MVKSRTWTLFNSDCTFENKKFSNGGSVSELLSTYVIHSISWNSRTSRTVDNYACVNNFPIRQ